MKKSLKYLVSLVILFHCLGVTQLVSAYSKDGSTFTSMLNMTEEETKKEKDSKEDNEGNEALKQRHVSVSPLAFQVLQIAYFFNCQHRLKHQFHPDNTTPPPDRLA